MDSVFQIRSVTPTDIKDIFELSNDPLVRKNSKNQNPISWNNHQVWFSARLKSTDPFFIAQTINGQFMAQIRFDSVPEPIISISISPKFRGQHLAAPLIECCSKKTGWKHIFAYIRQTNIPSINAFQKAGYKQIANENGYIKMQYTQQTYIIAEMSANHCGDKNLAKRIIAKAKEVGADAVKIQTYTADTITINCQNEEFQIKDEGNLWKGENLYQLYQKAFTPWQWQAELKAYADEIGIDFFSTPFDYTAVDFLESIQVPCYKIASFEAMDYPLIKYVAKFQKPMIISTGVSTLEDIQGAIDACHAVGNHDITLLKCTSAYPAQLQDMNICTVTDMITRFGPQGIKIGLSDHSMSNIPAITAVALGACMVEKHFTLGRKLGGADAGFSLEPHEFQSLVADIRSTEQVLGKIDYTVNPQNRKFARSLYIVKDIKKGEKFTPQNLRSIRPANGLPPKYYEDVLGKTATRDLPFGTPLKKEDYQ